MNTFFRFLSRVFELFRKEILQKRNLTRTLQELHNSIKKGDIEDVKKITDRFHQNLARNKQLLTEIYTSGNQCITQTDLILTACRNKQVDVLHYLLKETDMLVHLPDDSLDDTEVNKQRAEAFKHALTLKDFKIVEMLYDFWCGNLNWSGHNLKNIEMVGNVLQYALDSLIHYINDLQQLTDFYTLITFNEFQFKIYTEVAKLKRYDMKPEESATMILEILRIYDEYSHSEKVQAKHEIETHTQTCVNDDTSVYIRIQEYILNENYFRKLDFTVSWLVLEYVYVIRKHLKTRFNKTEKYFEDNPTEHDLYENTAKTYEQIESEIYHFIYRTSEDWRLYVTEKKQVKIIPKEPEYFSEIYERGFKNKAMTIKMHMIHNGAVIFFERENFIKCLEDLKTILKQHVIREDPGLFWMQNNENDRTKVKKMLNDNYLQTSSYMRDHYSLIKIVNYIRAIENTANVNVVMIERVLHVVGEMLKSTNDSLHLSRSTKALLQTAISVETISHLQDIRNFLSHSRGGELSSRIIMANTQTQRFEEIKKELIIIKEIINHILHIFKSILDKSLLEKGFRLLVQRLEALPDAKPHFDEIHRLRIPHAGLTSPRCVPFILLTWRETNMSDQILQEIALILSNKAQLDSKIQIAKLHHNTIIVRIIPSFIHNSKQMLDLIIENNKYVNSFNQELSNRNISVEMPECPDAKEINEIKKQVERLMVKNKNLQIDLKLLDNIKNYKDHWESVKGTLSFFLTECELFAPITDILTDTTITQAYDILAKMEVICANEKQNFAYNSSFLNKKHLKAIETMQNDAKKMKANDPRKAREELITCLISRLDLLKRTLLYPQKIPLSQLVRIFVHDMQFRIMIEMVLADIANVFAECNINRMMLKSSNLLRDIDLGNVLDHGNPFLEVIGDIFNSHELAAEWLDKAMMFAEDAESIEALYELFKGKMDYRTILEGDLLKMDDQQKQMYEQFKKSSNWESYALLARYPFPKSQRLNLGPSFMKIREPTLKSPK